MWKFLNIVTFTFTLFFIHASLFSFTRFFTASLSDFLLVILVFESLGLNDAKSPFGKALFIPHSISWKKYYLKGRDTTINTRL